MPVSRIFTPSEVEALIPRLSELVERQLLRQSEIEECLAELARRGGGLPKSLEADPSDPDEIARLKRELVERMGHYDEGWQEVQKLGAVVKDPQIGLVDFYGRIDGRLVWLCWRYGEETLRYFHELDSGYAGRKPLRPESRERLLN
jgi:hypothetical protein